MSGVDLVHNMQSQASDFTGTGDTERMEMVGEGMGEGGGVESFFMLTRIIAVRSMTDANSESKRGSDCMVE